MFFRKLFHPFQSAVWKPFFASFIVLQYNYTSLNWVHDSRSLSSRQKATDDNEAIHPEGGHVLQLLSLRCACVCMQTGKRIRGELVCMASENLEKPSLPVNHSRALIRKCLKGHFSQLATSWTWMLSFSCFQDKHQRLSNLLFKA